MGLATMASGVGIAAALLLSGTLPAHADTPPPNTLAARSCGPEAAAAVPAAAGPCVDGPGGPTTTDQLTVSGQTLGGTGGPFTTILTQPDGQTVGLGALTTTQQGTPGPIGTFGNGPTGFSTLTEYFPAPDGTGTWAATGALCNGVPAPMAVTEKVGASFTVGLTAAARVDCVITNAWTPAPHIDLSTTTFGGIGEVTFTVRPVGSAEAARTRTTTATTSRAGLPAVAPVVTDLPLGQYAITQRHGAVATGTWSPTHVVCDGSDQPIEDAPVIVDITAQHPVVACRFSATLVAPDLPPQPTATPAADRRPVPPSTPHPHAAHPDRTGNLSPLLVISSVMVAVLLLGTAVLLTAARQRPRRRAEDCSRPVAEGTVQGLFEPAGRVFPQGGGIAASCGEGDLEHAEPSAPSGLRRR
ncbi:hypothetical protein [Kitasatospora sp. MMS16-BH015]|uniref:hypothetical protein n=1 Tax=Kitasatospora sp. MMS16-BH015 TaxID=2018025 RepID=UPI00131A4D63|nr:hypothetical protein [Kitasatospora sp. MMS16-BH015]